MELADKIEKESYILYFYNYLYIELLEYIWKFGPQTEVLLFTDDKCEVWKMVFIIDT